MAIATRADRKIHYELIGKGPAVLLVPGIGAGAKQFGTLPRRFERAGFSCLTTTPVGLSPSGMLPDEFSFEEAAADLLAVVDAAGFAHCVPIGTSLGGKVSLHACLLAPHRFRRLVTVGSAFMANARAQAVNRFMELIAEECSTEYAGELLAPFLFGRTFQNNNPTLLADIVRGMQPTVDSRALMASQARAAQALDGESLVKRLEVPALCIAGSEDTLTPAVDVRDSADLMPQGTYLELPEAGHSLLLESREAFDACIEFAVAS